MKFYFKYLWIVFNCAVVLLLKIHAQTLGGSSVFNFLNLSNTAQLTALGSINVSNTTNNVGLAFNNPALLTNKMNAQSNLSFNHFLGNTSAYHASFAINEKKSDFNFLYGLNFINYGFQSQTDISGNVIGSFIAQDWVMQVSLSHVYEKKWNGGLTMKYIHSHYGTYVSTGIAADAALLYVDDTKKLSISVLLKNMGMQFKKYTGSINNELPFDFQAGLTKKLMHSPFSFSITLHHIHQFDLRFNDTAFNNNFGLRNSSNLFDQLFRHVVLSSTIALSPNIEIVTGFNYLRRKELKSITTQVGITGYSFGINLFLHNIQFYYGLSVYQQKSSEQQVSVSLQLNRMFGIGK